MGPKKGVLENGFVGCQGVVEKEGKRCLTTPVTLNSSSSFHGRARKSTLSVVLRTCKGIPALRASEVKRGGHRQGTRVEISVKVTERERDIYI